MAEPRDASIANTSVSDQAASKDSLGFAPYVTAIADFLSQSRYSTSLNVIGRRGMGKWQIFVYEATAAGNKNKTAKTIHRKANKH